MIRIGIIGTESSHAMAFAKYYNLPDENGCFHFDSIRVTALCGDEESVSAICNTVGELYKANTPSDMIGRVDAVMITSRFGSMHYDQAIPLIQSGIPLFIDKPITSSAVQASDLEKMLLGRGIPMLGGSNCRYAPNILSLKELVMQLRKSKKLISASVNYTLYDSPYDGFWFYSPHLVEIVLEIFGYEPVAVSASKNGKSMVATLSYPDTVVTLHFTLNLRDTTATIYTTEGVIFEKLVTTGGFAAEAKHFGNVLLGSEEPCQIKQLTKHVYVIEAIINSAQCGGKQIQL